MFIDDHLPVPAPLRTARHELERVLASGELTSASERAYQRGVRSLRRVGPSGIITKQVLVHWLEPIERGDTVVIPLRWQATGPTGALYPVLDGNLGLTRVDEATCLLSIVATYTPPFGTVGLRLDHAVLHRAAKFTVRTLLRQLAKSLSVGPMVSIAKPSAGRRSDAAARSLRKAGTKVPPGRDD